MVRNKLFNLNLTVIPVNRKEQKKTFVIESYCLDPDEFLAEIINGVQHADEVLQYNR